MSVVLESRDDLMPVNDAVRMGARDRPCSGLAACGPCERGAHDRIPQLVRPEHSAARGGRVELRAGHMPSGEDSTIVEFPVLVSSGSVNWGVVVVFIAALPLLVSAVWYLRRATGGRPARRPARRRR